MESISNWIGQMLSVLPSWLLLPVVILVIIITTIVFFIYSAADAELTIWPNGVPWRRKNAKK